MKYSLLLAYLLFTISSYAQDCTQEQLLEKPGNWKAGLKGQIVNVTAADLARERSVLAGIHKLISSGYKPKGCEVLYSNTFGKGLNAGENWISDPYTYSMYILRYLCDKQSPDKSKYYTDYATPTTVNISANAVFTFSTLYAANLPEDDMRGYLKLKTRPVKKDGFYFMGEEVVGDSHLKDKVKEYRWLITYNDTLPFSYVNRRDYLLIQKKRLEKTTKESPGDKEYNQRFFKSIAEELKKPDAYLDQVAVCMWNEEERFEKFVEEGTPGSFIAVRPNLAYFRNKLPKSSPQFFSVIYKIAHGDAAFEENIAAIQKAVDFAVLKNMLGK